MLWDTAFKRALKHIDYGFPNLRGLFSHADGPGQELDAEAPNGARREDIAAPEQRYDGHGMEPDSV